MPRPVKYTEPIAYLNVKIDRQLYEQFKSICTQRDKTITDVLVKYIREYVAKAQKATSPAKSKS